MLMLAKVVVVDAKLKQLAVSVYVLSTLMLAKVVVVDAKLKWLAVSVCVLSTLVASYSGCC